MTGFDSEIGASRQGALYSSEQPVITVRHAFARGLVHFARALASHARQALPQCCALCAAPSGNALVCASCERALPRVGEACPRCALPSPAAAPCGSCLAHPPAQHAALAVFAYAFPVDRLLQRFKYGGALALADWAAHALAAHARAGIASEAMPGLLVPVPLAPARQRERGYNQAHEIAWRVAAALALPCAPLLERVRNGVPQAASPWSERAANVRGAFACRSVVAGHVGVIDDVMTTGATLGEAARTLLSAGAARVSVWTVARTLPARGR